MDTNLPMFDVDAAENGRWCEFANGVSFKIAMDGNEKHIRFAQEYSDKVSKAYDAEKYDEVTRLNALGISTAILRGWKGLVSSNGVDIEYTEDNAVELLSDKRYKKALKFIEAQSKDDDAYDVHEEATVKK